MLHKTLKIRSPVFAGLITKLYRMAEFTSTELSLFNSQLQKTDALISYLKEEILQLDNAIKKDNCNIRQLKEENKKLVKEINLTNEELVKFQIANGVPQIPLPEEASTNVLRLSGEGHVKEEPVSASIENSSAPAPIKTKLKKQTANVAEEPPVDIGRLDIRVGKILHAQVHPDATQLYIEQIDVGDEISRTVVSGLVQHIPLADLDGRMVVVLCNLKPQKMRGIVSEAMVLCASTPETVELLTPPPEARAGDNITVPGYTRNPDLPFMNPKKKIFDKVAEDLIVNEKKQASYKGAPWVVEGKEGYVTVQALSGCHIR